VTIELYLKYSNSFKKGNGVNLVYSLSFFSSGLTISVQLETRVNQMIRWFFKKLRNFFSTEVSSEVPAELAACEFDCREVECLTEDFLNCPRRLQKKAETLKKL
jgi:hypothetical protein